jgi:thiamine kinase-like enzyme
VQPLEDRPMGLRRWAELAELSGLPRSVTDRLRTVAPDLAQLESRTLTRRGRPTAFVDSHGDLDPKNTLVADGRLLAVDWDAAGPRSFAREAVSLALDWSLDITGFRQALIAYTERSGRTIPAAPWVFGGWVEGMSEWLAYNAEERGHTSLGQREVSTACTRLLSLHRSLDEYVSTLVR